VNHRTAFQDGEPLEINACVAHEARVYDALLGGRDNFTIDRMAAEEHGRAVGGIDNARHAVRANRRFLGRAVRYLAADAGVRQFLDLGSGIPTQQNVHQIAQRVAPECRVVYADYDPIVQANAHALVNGTPDEAVAYVLADLRDIDRVISRAAVTLDLSQPVAVLLVSVLHFFADAEGPDEIVSGYLSQFASGSFLAVSHMAADIQPEAIAALAAATAKNDTIGYEYHPRSRARVARFLDGLDLVEPGVVPLEQWRPDGPPPPPPPGGGEPPFHAGVGHRL
jgi:hypothetical protein